MARGSGVTTPDADGTLFPNTYCRSGGFRGVDVFRKRSQKADKVEHGNLLRDSLSRFNTLALGGICLPSHLGMKSGAGRG